MRTRSSSRVHGPLLSPTFSQQGALPIFFFYVTGSKLPSYPIHASPASHPCPTPFIDAWTESRSHLDEGSTLLTNLPSIRKEKDESYINKYIYILLLSTVLMYGKTEALFM